MFTIISHITNDEFYRHPVSSRFGEYREWHPVHAFLYWDENNQCYQSVGAQEGYHPVVTSDRIIWKK